MIVDFSNADPSITADRAWGCVLMIHYEVCGVLHTGFGVKTRRHPGSDSLRDESLRGVLELGLLIFCPSSSWGEERHGCSAELLLGRWWPFQGTC